MGCSQSRKEYSFTEDEVKKLKTLFLKTANSYSETKDKNELSLQAFRDFFPENVSLGERLHEFMLKNSPNKKVDIDIFVDVLELILRKPTNKELGDVYLKHDKIGLLCAILFPHMRKGLKKDKYMNILINYSEGLDLVLSILHMLNGQPDQRVSDAHARTIVDRIFPTNESKIEFWSFGMLIKDQINLVSSLIHIYFKNKFLDGTVSFLLPKMPDISKQVLISKDQLTQLYLNNQYLLNASQLKLLYQGNQENYNFDSFASQLQSFTGETFVVLRFVDKQGNQYTVGGFNPFKWGQSGNDSVESYIFSLTPKYRHYYPVLDSQFSRPVYSQYCFLNTQESYGREAGLVFGLNREECRIWIDGKDLSKSFVKNTEKFFKKGNLLPPNIESPTCDLIEVYGIHTDQSKKNFTYSTINNMQLNQILAGSRDLRNSLTMNLESTRQSNLGKSGFQSQNSYITTGALYRTEGNDDIVKRSAAQKATQSSYTPQAYSTTTPISYNTTTYQTYSTPQTYTTTTTTPGGLPEYKSYYVGGPSETTNYTYTATGEPGRYSSQQPASLPSGERKTTVN